MKKFIVHIILDLIVGWALICGGIYFGLTWSFLLLIYTIPLVCWYSARTFIWIRMAIDVLFSTPISITTKGYRFALRQRVYPLLLKSTFHYSEILFDDVRLKGKYVFFDNSVFRHGEKLEIVYYPRSKYIKSIERIET